MSTLMVYGLTPEGVLDEAAPRQRTGDAYGDEKLEAEEIAVAYHVKRGLAVSVIQPTAVYGPFAPAWTKRVLERLKTGIVPLIDDGSGICNAVYIDDVADAVLLAAERDEAVGEAFLISGEPITYRDFYGCFEQMLGGKRTVSLSVEEALARWEAKDREQGEPMATKGASPVHLLDPLAIRFHALRTTVSTDKAHRRLGYRPHIDLHAGMRRTEQWARWANLIPPQSSISDASGWGLEPPTSRDAMPGCSRHKRGPGFSCVEPNRARPPCAGRCPTRTSRGQTLRTSTEDR